MLSQYFEKLRTDGFDIIRKDGLDSFLRRGVQYIAEDVSSQAKDYVVRAALNDKYSLPPDKRRVTDYRKAREVSARHYRLIACHTNTNFKKGLPDDYRIGDIGCGGGRMAVRFVENHPTIEYEGMDINADLIQALNNKFSDTTYNFHHLDVYNERYNPKGVIPPDKIELPFPDNHFDLLLLWSVFSHMRPETVKQYLTECQRVLKPDGQAWTNWFLILNDSDTNPPDRDYEFDQMGDGWYSMGTLHRVAYSGEKLREIVDAVGLDIETQVAGHWRDDSFYTDPGREEKDIVVFTPD